MLFEQTIRTPDIKQNNMTYKQREVFMGVYKIKIVILKVSGYHLFLVSKDFNEL